VRREEIKDTFEKFFEKYKKTEGDESSWSAVWTQPSPAGTFEINMTKCPEGTRFKVFLDNRKLGEIEGWDRFFDQIRELTKDHPEAYDEDEFFGDMRDMI
jgi:1,4-alpha-glucan branching enzyme